MQKTDGSGRINFSAYPLDTYTFEAYYNDEFISTLSFNPRTSDDVFFMKIDISNPTNYTNYNVISVNMSDINSNYELSSDIDLNFSIFSNIPSQLQSYEIELIQDGVVIDSETVLLDQEEYTEDYNATLTTAGITEDSFAYISVTIDYMQDGTLYAREFIKTISFYDIEYSGENALINIPGTEGRLLTTILSLIITIAIIGTLSTKGIIINSNSMIILAMVILGFFVAIGWLSTGTTVVGTDPIVFVYVLFVIFGLYMMWKSNQEY